mgnify:FL=1
MKERDSTNKQGVGAAAVTDKAEGSTPHKKRRLERSFCKAHIVLKEPQEKAHSLHGKLSTKVGFPVCGGNS